MEVTTSSQVCNSLNQPSWSPVGTWRRSPLFRSIRRLPGMYTLNPGTEAFISKRRYIVLRVNSKIAASNTAGAGSKNISETAIGTDTAAELHEMELHEMSSLRLAIREAHFGDYWEVADTHCGAFLPDLGFPMDAVLRFDRVVAMLGGFSLPSGRKRKFLVAVDGQLYEGLRHVGFSLGDFLSFTWKGFENGVRHELHLERILGILTVDTIAEFLPRRKPTGLRRTGIAYISNVAVRQRVRRRGIARRLVQEAELLATGWGCHSIALHCDTNNPGALALYLGAGYKLVKCPLGAKWPQPKAMPGSDFCLMMKCLHSK